MTLLKNSTGKRKKYFVGNLHRRKTFDDDRNGLDLEINNDEPLIYISVNKISQTVKHSDL